MKVARRPTDILESVNANTIQFTRNNGYSPSHIFMTKAVWRDIAEDSMVHDMCLDADKPSQHFRMMGLECKIIEGDIYEYYIAFCGS